MAVYKRTYRRYEGALTPAWSRFLVVPRYAFEEMHRSRFLSLFFLASLIFPLGCAVVIYIAANLNVLTSVGIQAPTKLNLELGSGFYLTYLGFQSMLAFFMASFIGPGLISPDLTNNALQLYLARPVSRAEYVLGKASVLMILLSLMTWIPGVLLFFFQGYFEGFRWVAGNRRLLLGLFAGSWVWIVVLTLLALALSAWVKWKPVAGALMFGVFFISTAFGFIVNNTLRTSWGHLINLSNLIGTVWVTLFEAPMHRGAGAVFFRVAPDQTIPAWACLLSLTLISLGCLELLAIKIRGVEVVK